ncbi:RRQRL motif-containing zinc-binding protein [Streptodolium elevatio]|uniref:RRQRL motif-containing zinc-binding protein n=1 Tax=Streptodolium elevatio TaxID=3157996 RepID=A0ABV3DTF5_9ACTN
MTGYGIYRPRLAPDGMATRRQLRAKGLRPNGQEPAGEIRYRRSVAYLYWLHLAAPVRPMTAAKQAALDAAMRARRTCPQCLVELPFCIPRRYGRCLPCEDAGN